MEAFIEYLIPETGLFKKKRSPRQVAAMEAFDDFDEIVKDFNEAKSFNEDKVRIGRKNIYRKERVMLVRKESVAKAEYCVAGADGDTEVRLLLQLTNGSIVKMCTIYNEDPKRVAAEIFTALQAMGIPTVL